MIEEKLHKELDWLSVKHIDADKIIETILSICKQEIAEACKKQRDEILLMAKIQENEDYMMRIKFDAKPIIYDVFEKRLAQLKSKLAPSPLDEVK